MTGLLESATWYNYERKVFKNLYLDLVTISIIIYIVLDDISANSSVKYIFFINLPLFY